MVGRRLDVLLRAQIHLGDEVSDSDYEFKYALADEIDEIIWLEINDAHFMSFNRDDDRHKGVVVRVS